MNGAVAPAGDRGPVSAGSVLPTWTPFVATAVAIGVATPAACWLAHHVRAGQTLHDVALFAHLASLVVGFGSVLVVDWVALRWAFGRRTLADVIRCADDVTMLIWIGYAGLVASGVLLSPDLAGIATRVKLGAVVLIGWNGLIATALSRRIHTRPSPHLMLASAACAGVSQAAWWTATAIGFLNAR
jgi:hypothetical protein